MQFTIGSIAAILAIASSAAAAPAAELETRAASTICNSKSYIDLMPGCSNGQSRYNVYIPANYANGGGCKSIHATLNAVSESWNKGDTNPNGIDIKDYTCTAASDGNTWLGFDWCDGQGSGINGALGQAYPAFAGQFNCKDK